MCNDNIFSYIYRDVDDPIEFPLRSNFVDEIGRPSGSCIIYESGKSPVERQRNGGGGGSGRDDVVLTSNKDTLDDGNFETEMEISGLSYGLKAAQQKPSNNSKFEQNSVAFRLFVNIFNVCMILKKFLFLCLFLLFSSFVLRQVSLLYN